MKVYITKYALTQGIYYREVDSEDADYDKYYWGWPGGMNGTAMFKRSECFESLDDAIKQVRKMVAAKTSSLQKQIKKLEGITAKSLRDGVKK